jgi:hypothetical protein
MVGVALRGLPGEGGGDQETCLGPLCPPSLLTSDRVLDEEAAPGSCLCEGVHEAETYPWSLTVLINSMGSEAYLPCPPVAQ